MRLALFLLLNPGLGAFAATVGPTDRFIPIVQDGGGWTTTVSITNLSDRPAYVIASFLTANGFLESWKIELKASAGRVSGSSVEGSLAPGATLVIESAGTGSSMVRGFADIVEARELPLGVQATLVQKSGEQTIQSFSLALTPAHERRAVMPLDLRPASGTPELVFVSLTSSVQLDLIFRDLAGRTVLEVSTGLDGKAQLSILPLENWPELAGFQGTVQWVVTFPAADRYEQRTLCGLQLVTGGEHTPWNLIKSMTLPADQGKTDPY